MQGEVGRIVSTKKSGVGFVCREAVDMDTGLREIVSFPTDQAFADTEKLIHSMVNDGKLISRGLDIAKSPFYLELYQDLDGAIWTLAVPDHAFRGYLKRA